MKVNCLIILIIASMFVTTSCVTNKVIQLAKNRQYHESFQSVQWIKALNDSVIVIKGYGNYGRKCDIDTFCLAIFLPTDYKHIATGDLSNNSMSKKYYKQGDNVYWELIENCKTKIVKDTNLNGKRDISFGFFDKKYRKRDVLFNFSSEYLDTLIRNNYYSEIICLDNKEGNISFDHLIKDNNGNIYHTTLFVNRTFKYHKRKYFYLLPLSVAGDIVLIPVYIPVAILASLGIIRFV